MYQLEVKRWLVFHKFPAVDGWDVTMDIDAMERGEKGQHPPGKREIAAACEAWLHSEGVKIVAHPLYGRADLVAAKESEGTSVVEVEGDSSRQKEQAMYSALGQIMLSRRDPSPQITYALAVPDSERWERQMRKVPAWICELLRLRLWLVSKAGVRSVSRVAPPNNSLNPTARSLPFINVMSCDLACVVLSGGGLIRAFGGLLNNLQLVGLFQTPSRSRLTSGCFIFWLVLNIVACYIFHPGGLVVACRIPLLRVQWY
jgi:hypothetical protein